MKDSDYEYIPHERFLVILTFDDGRETISERMTVRTQKTGAKDG